MGDKTPDTGESGIERRNVLKGLGFGAMSAVGAGAFADNVAAQAKGEGVRLPPSGSSMIDYANLVKPGADADSPTGEFADRPDGGMDLVFQLDSPDMGGPRQETRTISYDIVFVRRENKKPVLVEDRTRSFAGTVQTTVGGEVQRREEFSTGGLQHRDSTDYWAVLTVVDYTNSELTKEVDEEGEQKGTLQTDGAIIDFSIGN
jgi:hypothetical protein